MVRCKYGISFECFFSFLLLHVTQELSRQASLFLKTLLRYPVIGWEASIRHSLPERVVVHAMQRIGLRTPDSIGQRSKTCGEKKVDWGSPTGNLWTIDGPAGLSRLLIPASPDQTRLEHSGLRINEIPRFHCETTVSFRVIRHIPDHAILIGS